jgi:phosphoribosyl 1,2-cyclic phosphodiesterase
MKFLKICSLNSGSNGNCYYIENENEAVLVDAGISCRETERRMNRAGLSLSKVRGIFISHEHTDHTRGAEVISKKYGIPVYITDRTYRNSRLMIAPGLRRYFSPDEPVNIGELKVTAFPKWHDAAEPHSFTVLGNDLTVGVFTDIGTACDQVSRHLAQCNAAFLEANYDEGMLDRGRYPLYLKRRIKGAEGHLSNMQALDLFLTHRTPILKLLILSHLSAENNHPEVVRTLFSQNANGTRIEIASRWEESEVFTIG